MSIWFTADEHYGHQNIIKFCDRPFLDLAEMREVLIRRHNMVVQPGDIVHHIGDMFWRTLTISEARDIVMRLNGHHFYVLGNHEELMEYPELRGRFHHVAERRHIFPEEGPEKGIVLDHYAGQVWHHSDKGSWQLYGHTHAELPDQDQYLSMDVGVDANDFYPVPLWQVKDRMAEKRKRTLSKFGIKEKK